MRKLRNLPKTDGYFLHAGSHFVPATKYMSKKRRDRYMRRFKKRCKLHGIVVLSLEMMGNHFHALLYIKPYRRIPSDPKRVLALMKKYYGEKGRQYRKALKAVESGGQALEDFMEKFKGWWGNVSMVIQVFKTEVSKDYNMEEECFGTRWATRFFSRTISLTDPISLLEVACYIAMNPVVAGLVDLPEDYRWSTYALACKGDRKARAAIQRCASVYNFAEARRAFERLFPLVIENPEKV